MAFRAVSDRFMMMVGRDVGREEKDLKMIHSISKQLLEELAHAQHGLEANEIGHVKRELKSLIAALKESDRRAKHAEKVWGRMKHEAREAAKGLGHDLERIERYDATVLEYLHDAYRRLDAWDRQTVRQLIGALESLNVFAEKLHGELHTDILQRQIPGHHDIAYRPPHHV